MDAELPRTPGSFNNRILLARELKVEHMLHESKQNNYPVKSVLEIVLFVFLNQSETGTEHFHPKVSMTGNSNKRKLDQASFEKWSRIIQAVHQSANVSVHKSQLINIDQVQWFYRQLLDRGMKIDFKTLVHIYCNCFSKEHRSNFIRQSVGRPWSSDALKGTVKLIDSLVLQL